MATIRFKSEHFRLIEHEVHAAFGDDVSVGIHLVDSLPHLPNAKHRDYVRLDQTRLASSSTFRPAS